MKASHSLKLLTLNTHSWLEVHQLHKIRTLAKFIVDHEIDVIALQEVNQLSDEPPTDTPVNFLPVCEHPLKDSNFGLFLMRYLAELTPQPYTFSWVDSHEGWGLYDEGLMMITRLPVLSAHRLVVSHEYYTFHDVFRRCALAFEIATEHGPAWFVSVHMNWWVMHETALFEHDFASLDQQIRRLADDAPIFLLGDFNNDAAIADEGYAQIRSLGWADAFDHARQREGEFTVHKSIAGWEEAIRTMRLDYIFSSHPIPFDSHRVVFADNTEAAISDHSGLIGEFDPAQLRQTTPQPASSVVTVSALEQGE